MWSLFLYIFFGIWNVFMTWRFKDFFKYLISQLFIFKHYPSIIPSLPFVQKSIWTYVSFLDYPPALNCSSSIYLSVVYFEWIPQFLKFTSSVFVPISAFIQFIETFKPIFFIPKVSNKLFAYCFHSSFLHILFCNFFSMLKKVNWTS